LKGGIILVKRKKFDSEVESLDMCETEDEGFIEGDVNIGKTIAAFNFGGNALEIQPVLKAPAPTLMPGISIFKTSTRGLTPTVDGEGYTVKRGYQFRPSTLRKLSELKARHPDVNAYLNTILDEAINHYYYYIFNEKRS
jgi:hypothetical protein